MLPVIQMFKFPLIGGALIGIAASLMLLFNGRVTGISGILNQAFERTAAARWRIAFLLGLVVGGFAIRFIGAANGFDFFGDGSEVGMGRTIAAGLFVGFGTLLGSGCTSGHGVCGVSRLSPRSIAATVTFILAGVATVALLEKVMR